MAGRGRRSGADCAGSGAFRRDCDPLCRFSDGRGYSLARALLRERYGYRGELRAIGDVLRDQLFIISRCGFDAFCCARIRIPQALSAFDDFSEAYQASVERPDHCSGGAWQWQAPRRQTDAHAARRTTGCGRALAESGARPCNTPRSSSINRRILAMSDEFVDYVLELFGPFGTVAARRMFGGYGVYLDGLMFAIMSGDTLYLKADEMNRIEFEQAGCGDFQLCAQGAGAPRSISSAHRRMRWNPAELMLPWARAPPMLRLCANAKKQPGQAQAAGGSAAPGAALHSPPLGNPRKKPSREKSLPAQRRCSAASGRDEQTAFCQAREDLGLSKAEFAVSASNT